MLFGWAVLTAVGAVYISAVAAFESAMRRAVSTIARSLPGAEHAARSGK